MTLLYQEAVNTFYSLRPNLLLANEIKWHIYGFTEYIVKKIF